MARTKPQGKYDKDLDKNAANYAPLTPLSFLARAAIYQGDYHAAERFVSDLRRIRPDDIRQAARTYMKNFSFAYVGDPSRLDRSLIDRF